MTSPPANLSEEAKAVWRLLVGDDPSPVALLRVEFAAVQVARAREAQRLVDDEGVVTLGGPAGMTPVAHPAVGVERAAQELVRRWTEVRPAAKESSGEPVADDATGWVARLVPAPVRDSA